MSQLREQHSGFKFCWSSVLILAQRPNSMIELFMVFISLSSQMVPQLGHNASFQILSNLLFTNHAIIQCYTGSMGNGQSLNKIKVSVCFTLQHSVTTF
jgi:hypothetical protein